MRHLNADWIIGYAEGRLDPQKKESVEHHLESCSFCTNEAFEWLSILDALKGSNLQSAPLHAIRACEAVFRITKPVSRLREIFARVIFDSALVPAAAGVRGATDSQQICLRSDEFDVHLRVGGTPRVIVGQMLQRSEGDFVAGARVGILHDGEEIQFTITDSLGEFRIDNAPSGALRFQADLPTDYRLLGDFNVKETRG